MKFTLTIVYTTPSAQVHVCVCVCDVYVCVPLCVLGATLSKCANGNCWQCWLLLLLLPGGNPGQITGLRPDGG